MAERRMFAKTIVGSDAFTEMPLSSQALYFHICMEADDDGFVNNPNKIRKMIGASEDDLKVLIAKRFLLRFDSGVVVAKHWRINNIIRSDRYKGTIYQDEFHQLQVKNDGAYTERKTFGIPSDNQVTTDGIPSDNQVATNGIPSIGKDRLGKDSIGYMTDNDIYSISSQSAGAREEYPKSELEMRDYAEFLYPEAFMHYDGDAHGIIRIGYDFISDAIGRMFHFYSENGWKDESGQPIKNWKAVLKQSIEQRKAECGL